MPNPSQPFVEEKNKSVNQPIFLYKIYNWDGEGNDLLYVPYPTPVTFAGEVYLPFPISHESVSENAAGQVDKVAVRVSNVNRLIGGYLESYEFRAKKCRIRTVFANMLDDDDAFLDDIYYIDDYVVMAELVEFNLSSKFDVVDKQLPKRRYTRNFCSWIFKGAECKYSGSAQVCSKTLQRCRELNNVVNFGGFPSIPYKRLIV